MKNENELTIEKLKVYNQHRRFKKSKGGTVEEERGKSYATEENGKIKQKSRG